ncbi:hypothetical protein GF351_01610 [Candidatus Woesearchaeota archaeon]|nr:hypothetical protein [Candidatus Woesearchaeota archaeon]
MKIAIALIMVVALLTLAGCGEDSSDTGNENATQADETLPDNTEQEEDEVVVESEDDEEPDEEQDSSQDTNQTGTDEGEMQYNQTDISLQPEDDSMIVVQIKDFRFVPKELTIRPGMTIKWVNAEPADSKHYYKIRPRRSYDKTPNWASDLLYAGDAYNYTFEEKGEFEYVDAVFVGKQGTEGRIIVK